MASVDAAPAAGDAENSTTEIPKAESTAEPTSVPAEAAASAGGAKRVAEENSTDAPPAKVAKLDDATENKGEPAKEEKEKEKKEKKKDKEKDKEKKKEKKEKKEGKENKENKESKETADGANKDAEDPGLKKLPSVDMDQRKLFKEGQKFMTPPVADATRAFYESLLEENPESRIAIRFCVENGVLAKEKHDVLLKKYNKLKEKGVFDVRTQIKRALEKKDKKEKDGKEKKKDKKDKSEKKEKKEKKEKEAETQ